MEWVLITATVLGGVAALGYFYDKGRRLRKRLAMSKAQRQLELSSANPQQPLSEKEKTISTLLRYLKNDLDESGLHHGQFGRGQRVVEEERYQTTKEKLDTKPRLYLTGWPVFILLKNREKLPSEEMLESVRSGILDLFDDGWIYISMGAQRYTSPVASSRAKGTISYRHTIRGAQILLAIDSNIDIPRAVLGKMLDPSADMQTKEGGWRQCNINFREEDLWGTSYAAGFLHTCINQAEILNLESGAINKAHKSLERTLAWLHKRWNEDGWSYDEVPSEENATILFPEVAQPAIGCRPKLATSVLRSFETYLDPTNQPSSLYLDKNSMVGPCAAVTRLAYNFFITKPFRNDDDKKWLALRDYALQHIQSGYNCVEASMLLDMLLTDIDT
jgi:hypothetical protein